jgi:hypothetical protein
VAFKKLSYSIITISVFLVLAALILNSVLASGLREIYGEVGDKRTIVNLKQPYTSGAGGNSSIKDAFTLEEFEKIEDLLKGYKVSALSNDEVMLQYKWNNVQTDVKGVNSEFFKFNSTSLLRGRLLSKEDIDKKSNVIVIDEELAEKLFSSTEVLGHNVRIYEQEFKIIGVVGNQKSTIDSFLYDGKPSLYMPISSFTNTKETSNIITIEVNTDKKSNVESALRNAGKNTNRYNFFELSKEERIVRQNNKIIIFILGVLLIIKLGGLLKANLSRCFYLLKTMGSKEELKNIIFPGTAAIILILLIAGIWFAIRFEITIPKEYVPSDMPNMEFFKELFKNIVLEKNQKLGYIASRNELRFGIVKSISSILTLIALIAGIPLLYLGNLLVFYNKKIFFGGNGNDKKDCEDNVHNCCSDISRSL